MANPVSWDVAERVAVKFAARPGILRKEDPPLDVATWETLHSDFDWATTEAERLVVEATGLTPASGPIKAQVVDRPGWIANNIASFRRVLDPALDQLPGAALPGPLANVTSAATATQVGLLLGWMSTRVLGQYDPFFTEPGVRGLGDGEPEADGPEAVGPEAVGPVSFDPTGGDVVSYVGPNIVALERRCGFPERHFRLWIALHEVTHRCQFTGVPWLHSYFLSLVDEGLSALRPDPAQFVNVLHRALEAVRSRSGLLDDAGIIGLIATPAQLDAVRKVQALMSLLEGHGDVTMGRAGADAVPEADWFASSLRERRQRASLPQRIIQQVTGLEAKLRQYEQGEKFIDFVERSGGDDLFRRVWEGPDQLPSMAEIHDPGIWIERQRTTPSVVA